MPKPLDADAKLTKLYHYIQNRLSEYDRMSAPQYAKIEVDGELKKIKALIDQMDVEEMRA